MPGRTEGRLMANDSVTLDIDDRVARLTLSNPPKRNALTWNMYDQLEMACRHLGEGGNVRVVIIRGDPAGHAFAAGTDINQFRDFTDAAQGIAYEHYTAKVLDAVTKLHMPVIAAVDGPAVGAGLAIAICCDLIVATPSSVFGAPIARSVGNCLSASVLAHLYTRLGRTSSLAMLLTASTMRADSAQTRGLVSAIATPEDLDGCLNELADRVAANAPLSLAAIKEADHRLMRFAETVDCDDLYRICYGSRDFSEGVTAFVLKREPHWEGR